MRLGMGITTKDMAGTPLTTAGVSQRAKLIEDTGFDGIWVGDGFPSFSRMDVLSWLLVAAAATEHVELGTSILIVPMQHPISLAHRIITMNALAPKRFSLGVGTGSEWEGHEIMGSDFDTRFTRFYQDMETIRELCAGTPLDELTHIEAPSPELRARMKRPTARVLGNGVWGEHLGKLVGGPKFILGAYHSPISLKRAANEFDGWICSAGRTNFNTMAEAIKIYRDLGGKRAMVSSCHVDLRANEKANDDQSFYLLCSPEEARDRLGRIQELGFDDIFLVSRNTRDLRPLYEQDYTAETLEELRTLLPKDDSRPYDD